MADMAAPFAGSNVVDNELPPAEFGRRRLLVELLFCVGGVWRRDTINTSLKTLLDGDRRAA